MYKNMLPIGSIVQLKGGERKLMVCGRIISNGELNQIFDYVGCLYPDGITDSSNMFFFNRDNIEDCFFIGFQDKEELNLRRNVFDNLGELEIRDGKIVSKEA